MANSIDELLPGEWYQFPSSRLDQSGVWPPSPQPPGTPSTIMTAWCGGLWDWRRNRLIIHGGGHGDYAGNEICAFSISQGTWARIWGPTPNAFIHPAGAGQPTYGNGDPASVHSYDGLIYIPDLDVYMRFCGSVWSGAGDGTKGCWIWNPNTSAWTRVLDFPHPGGAGVSPTAEYDRNRGLVWVTADASSSAVLYKYNVYNNTWQSAGVSWQGAEDPNFAIDPDNDVGVYVGNGRVFSVNLATNAVTQRTTGGPQVIVTARGPGLTWDPVLRRIVGWMGGTSVYSLNTSTWIWTQHTPAGTNAVTPPQLGDGGFADRILGGFPFSKFQYIPSKNAYIVVNTVSSSVYAYRLTANPFPNRTWASRPAPTLGQGPYPGSSGGKHSRMTFNSRLGEVTFTGGDYSEVSPNPDGAGNARIWSRDILKVPADNSWTNRHGFCSAAGQLMPGRPDNVGWVYDSTRNKFYTFPGFYFAVGCAGSTVSNSAVQFDPVTGLYSAVSWPAPPGGRAGDGSAYGGDLGSSYAVYDPIGDTVYRWRGDQLERLVINSGTWPSLISASTFFGAGTYDFHSDQPCIDIQGRAVYVYERIFPSGGSGFLVKYNILTQTMTRFAVPGAVVANMPVQTDFETYTAFDPVSRAVLVFGQWSGVGSAYDGALITLGIFHVDTQVWETETPNQSNVRMNVIGFDEEKGVVVALGRTQNAVWTYRFGEAVAAPPVTPDPPVLTTPASGATGVSLNPTLLWNASAGATSYQLQVSTASNFSSTIFDQAGLTGTSQALSNLLSLTQYFWRVRASNAVGTSSYSTVSNFTTASAIPLAPTNLRRI